MSGNSKQPNAPRGLKAAGRRLWDAGMDEYDFAVHEQILLEAAARTQDRIVELDRVVVDEGVMLSSSQGRRVNPAVAEARQQRLTLARLVVSLALPPLEDDLLPKSRGVRGVYRSGV
jgi:hypothetical protein